jgi:UDP-GlcNAc:undecaprenyl-phosphate GlcNAc-1-phosphate transferase
LNPGDLNSKFDFVIGAGPQSDGRVPEKRVDRGDMVAAVMFVLSLLALALTYQTPAAGFARLALSAAMAMGLTRFFTPVVARAALRCGVVDRPDGRLKNHAAPVPYLGGLALGLGFFISLSLLFRYDQRMTGILLAGAIALLLGLVDDMAGLSWRAKFAGQGLAVLVLLKSGVVMSVAALPLWANVVLSALWLMTLVNALNLIDISDGLAPGVALFAAGAFVVMAIFSGAPLLAILSATLFGALAGFAPFNAAPARIYLGDAGSMFLGLTLGGISLAGSYTAASPWGLAAPVLILAVPLFDTVYVMTLRLARGRNPFLGSPDHLAVRLRRRGWSAQAIALAGTMSTLICAAAGLSLLFLPSRLAPWPVAGVVMGLVLAGALLVRQPVAQASSYQDVAVIDDRSPARPVAVSVPQDQVRP